jgi:hypothetical protein
MTKKHQNGSTPAKQEMAKMTKAESVAEGIAVQPGQQAGYS